MAINMPTQIIHAKNASQVWCGIAGVKEQLPVGHRSVGNWLECTCQACLRAGMENGSWNNWGSNDQNGPIGRFNHLVKGWRGQ